jgi:hypothetical protein
LLTLACIADGERRPEKDLWQEFETARPRILDALLDVAAHGLRRLSGVHLPGLPRMADFALWTAASETAIWPPETFLRAYGDKLQDRNRRHHSATTAMLLSGADA